MVLWVLAALLALALAPALLPAKAWAADLGAAAGQAFLAGNAKKPGVMVRPSGLQYRALRSGGGRRVMAGDTVQVQFSGSLINGALVDGTSPGLPATLVVGNVIRGLNEALQMMHVGDHWQIVLPPSLAFGAAGSGTAVPADQVMVFDLTLLSAATPTGPVLGDPQISLSPMNRQEGNIREQGAILSIPQ
jgi:FKBP-type peptidyl-prolyl cis-trans isomerase